MSSNLAIKVMDLSKCYQLYEKPHDRLKQSIVPRLQELFGLPPRQYFRKYWALKNCSFEIERGETVGVIGQNGSGKSTLLQLICGTLTPTSGVIEVQGRVAALLELGAGFHPEFTGRENVYMNGALLGLTKEEIDGRFDEIAAFADIGEYLDQPVKLYSSGMFVRLAFAVIAHVDADVLVIDEALAVGDAFFVQKCMRFLRRFMAQGTILLVSHDTRAVLNLCSKSVLLENGSIIRVGTAKSICDQYCQLLYESQHGTAALDAGGGGGLTASILSGGARQLSESEGADTSMSKDLLAGKEMFGAGKAWIQSVTLRRGNGQSVCTVTQREQLILVVTCRTSIPLVMPIVGFLVRDRLGQVLFGQNGYLNDASKPIEIEADAVFRVEFEFWMPLLQQGDYTITAALAEGTQQHHVQHHWLHDALVFKSAPIEQCYGSIGLETLFVRIYSYGPGDSKDEAVISSAAL
jgi:lipopolysaccharide transport system ATP-binding protein